MRRAVVVLEGAELRLRAPKAFQLGLRDASVANAAFQVLGRNVNVVVETAAADLAPATEPAPGAAPVDPGFNERVLEHPGVKRFQELFPGAHVRTVRNLNE